MLQANIGAQRAAELFYTAEWVDAEKALSQGIVAQVLPAEELFDHAMAKAREIAQWPVNALREIKRSLRMHHLPAIEIAMQAEQAAMARQAGLARKHGGDYCGYGETNAKLSRSLGLATHN